MNPLSPIRFENHPSNITVQDNAHFVNAGMVENINLNLNISSSLLGRVKAPKKKPLVLSEFVEKLKSKYERQRYSTYFFESGIRLDICKDFVPLDLAEKKWERGVTASSVPSQIKNVGNLFPDGKKSAINRFLIEANPGGGKTTICRYIANAFADLCWHDQFKVVIWINLIDLVEDSTPIDLYQAISLLYSIGTEKSVRELLSPIESEILFLVDGYDEVDSHFHENKYLQYIVDKIREKPNWIITSRPSFFPKQSDEEVHYLEMVGFNCKGRDRYILDFFRNNRNEEKIQTVIKYIKVRPDLYSIPIILEIICSLFLNQDQPLSLNTITEVYEGMFAGILKWYFRKKGNFKASTWDVETLIDSLPFPQSIRYLEESAFREVKTLPKPFHFEKTSRVDQKQSDALVEQTASLGFTKCEMKNEDKLRGKHNFLHQTFHDYFAARYLTDCIRENREIDGKSWQEFVQKQKFNQQYAIIFRFTAGLLSSPKLEEFLVEIVSPPNSLLGIHEWVLAANCLEEVADSKVPQLRSMVIEKVFQWLHRIVGCKCIDLDEIAMIFKGLKKIYSGDEILVLLDRYRELDGASINLVGALEVCTLPLAERLLEMHYHGTSSADFVIPHLFRWMRYESEEMVVKLVENLKDEDEWKISQTLEIIGQVEPHTEEKIGALVDLLENERFRYLAAQILSYIQPKSTQAISRLISLLSSPNEKIRYWGVEILANSKYDSEEVALALIPLVSDSSSEVAKKAYNTLRKLKLQSMRVEARLILLLTERDFKTAIYAADILSSIEERSEEFIESRIQEFQNKGIFTPSSIQILLNIRADSVVLRMHLRQFIVDTDPKVRLQALRTIGFFMPVIESLHDQLQILLKDEDNEVRFEVAKVLVKQNANFSEAVDVLFSFLVDSRREYFNSARDILLEILPSSSFAKEKISLFAFGNSHENIQALLSKKKTLSKIVSYALVKMIECHVNYMWFNTGDLPLLMDHTILLLENENNLDHYVEVLVKISRENSILAEKAFDTLTELNPQSVKALTVLVIASEKGRFYSLGSSILQMVPRSEEAIRFCLHTKDRNGWCKALLRHAEPANDVSLETAIEMLKDESIEVPQVAINHLKRCNLDSLKVTQALLSFIKFSNSHLYGEFSPYFGDLVFSNWKYLAKERTLLLEALAAAIVLTCINAFFEGNYLVLPKEKIPLQSGEREEIQKWVEFFLQIKLEPISNRFEGVESELEMIDS